MKKTFLIASLAALGFLFTPDTSALAQSGKTQTTLLGSYGNWHAYKATENGHPVCYMQLKGAGAKAKGTSKGRGDITVTITHRPAEGSKDVFSYDAGVKFDPTREATVHVDGESYKLFTENETAWSRDAATDRVMAKALRRANDFSFEGYTADGQKISDKVDLKGSSASYKAISKACNLPIESAN